MVLWHFWNWREEVDRVSRRACYYDDDMVSDRRAIAVLHHVSVPCTLGMTLFYRQTHKSLETSGPMPISGAKHRPKSDLRAHAVVRTTSCHNYEANGDQQIPTAHLPLTWAARAASAERCDVREFTCIHSLESSAIT